MVKLQSWAASSCSVSLDMTEESSNGFGWLKNGLENVQVFARASLKSLRKHILYSTGPNV